MKQHAAVLNNGIKVMHYHLPATNSVAMCSMFKTGSVNEAQKDHGMSHFLEHMMFDGSQNFQDVEDTHIYLERLGVVDNAWTFKNMTNYWMKLPNESIDDAVAIMFDRMFHPLFSEEAVSKEKGVISEEIKMGLDNPWRVSWNNLAKSLFAGTQLEHPVIGTHESINAFTPEQIRSFYEKNYTLETLHVWVGGNISFEEVKDRIENVTPPKRKTDRKQIQNVTTRSQGVIFEQKDVTTNYVLFGIDGIGYTNDNVDLFFLISTILGTGKGSLLHNKLKIKDSLVTEVNSDTFAFETNGVLTIDLNCSPRYTEKAVELTIRELQHLAEGKIAKKDLTRAQNMIVSSFTKLQEASEAFGQTEGYYNLIRRELLSSKSISFDDVLDRITKATVSDISTVMQHALKLQSFWISIVGPDPAIEGKVQAILTKRL